MVNPTQRLGSHHGAARDRDSERPRWSSVQPGSTVPTFSSAAEFIVPRPGQSIRCVSVDRAWRVQTVGSGIQGVESNAKVSEDTA